MFTIALVVAAHWITQWTLMLTASRIREFNIYYSILRHEQKPSWMIYGDENRWPSVCLTIAKLDSKMQGYEAREREKSKVNENNYHRMKRSKTKGINAIKTYLICLSSHSYCCRIFKHRFLCCIHRCGYNKCKSSSGTIVGNTSSKFLPSFWIIIFLRCVFW